MAAEMNSMGSIITRITVQKSWKVALAALALAGLLVSGAAAHVVTPLVADFNSGTDGFAYLDDTFRGTSQPNYASGSRLSSGGVSGGCLQVLVGGVNNSSFTNMSGGWRRTFTLSEEA